MNMPNWTTRSLTKEERAENKLLKELHAKGRAKSFRLNEPKTRRERASIKEKKLTPVSETKKTGGTIKRMTGGVGHKTTKGTSVQDIERMRKDWEEAPMKGTTGPYNPKKMRLKKKKDTSVTIKKLPTSRKQAMSANERKELIGIGAHPGDIKGTVEHKKWQREKKRAAEQTPATQAKTGGTVKRKSGGALGTGAALRGFGRGYKKGGTI